MTRRPHDDSHEYDIIGDKPSPRDHAAGLGPLFAFANESAIARDSDPITSHKGSDHIAPKRRSQRETLLAVYRAYPEGLTDEEACRIAGLEKGGWKRCSELRTALDIVPTKQYRVNLSGTEAEICVAAEFATRAA